MDDFYVTLPSSVKNPQFNNTSSRYVTRLPQVLRLEKAKYNVAVTDIIYPYSFTNVGRSLNYWIHFKNREPLCLTFPSAQYNDVNDIVGTLNEPPVRMKRHAPPDADEPDVKKTPSAIDAFNSLKSKKPDKPSESAINALNRLQEGKPDKPSESAINAFNSLQSDKPDKPSESPINAFNKGKTRQPSESAISAFNSLQDEKPDKPSESAINAFNSLQDEKPDKPSESPINAFNSLQDEKPDKPSESAINAFNSLQEEKPEEAVASPIDDLNSLQEEKPEKPSDSSIDAFNRLQEKKAASENHSPSVDIQTSTTQTTEPPKSSTAEQEFAETESSPTEVHGEPTDEASEGSPNEEEVQTQSGTPITAWNSLKNQKLANALQLQRKLKEDRQARLDTLTNLKKEWRDTLKNGSEYHKIALAVFNKPEDKNVYENLKTELTRIRSLVRVTETTSANNYLNFKNTNDQIEIEFLDPNILFVEFEPACSYFLGFSDPIVRESCIAPSKVDFFGNVSTIYLYCDIVDPIIVGDQKNSLLAVIPCKGKYGEMVHHTIPYPRYLPIMNNTIDSVKVEFLSEFAEPINFHWGSTIIVLHFKKNE
ncbi:hypothetical protein B9Z55_017600 [Caenorhabditis nigoni]|uniref:Uncharacterized protein n=1 Tax=Caenorhabditis nigoni TaxID=1611254 RepID=A0A2G5TA63_9PELO|nr:hypothetical protein B9Z55_017600 [Caenorhabditis nigoni]